MANSSAPGSSDRLANTLTELLAPVAESAGLDLEVVEVVPAGKRRVLRVVVDRDGGVDLDGVADTSRAFASVLDERDVMGATPYVLEVTSPGVDRPLTEHRHWRRAVGRLVRVRLRGGGDVRGRIVRADDDGVTLATDSGTAEHTYADLGRGRIEVEFDRPKAGAGGSAPT